MASVFVTWSRILHPWMRPLERALLLGRRPSKNGTIAPTVVRERASSASCHDCHAPAHMHLLFFASGSGPRRGRTEPGTPGAATHTMVQAKLTSSSPGSYQQQQQHQEQQGSKDGKDGIPGHSGKHGAAKGASPLPELSEQASQVHIPQPGADDDTVMHPTRKMVLEPRGSLARHVMEPDLTRGLEEADRVAEEEEQQVRGGHWDLGNCTHLVDCSLLWEGPGSEGVSMTGLRVRRVFVHAVHRLNWSPSLSRVH